MVIQVQIVLYIHQMELIGQHLRVEIHLLQLLEIKYLGTVYDLLLLVKVVQMHLLVQLMESLGLH